MFRRLCRGVCSIIEQNDISSFEEIISALQDYVTNGLIIVEMTERIYIISPYLDSRLSWFEIIRIYLVIHL